MKDNAASNIGQFPKVSFVMPTLNAADILENCLQSIAGQTWPRERYEILLADAGSTDGTREIAKRYGAVILDDHGRNMEEGKRLALAHATGDYIVFVDADNEFTHPDYVELAVQALANHPQALGVESYYLPSPKMSSFCAYLTHLLQISDPVCWLMSAEPVRVGAGDEESVRCPPFRVPEPPEHAEAWTPNAPVSGGAGQPTPKPSQDGSEPTNPPLVGRSVPAEPSQSDSPKDAAARQGRLALPANHQAEVERWTLPPGTMAYPLGANGFVFRKADLDAVKAQQHFQDTHVALHLMQAGKREWLRIRGRGVHHYYVQTLWGFLQKRRRAMVHFLNVRQESELTWIEQKPPVPGWLACLYCVSVVGPLYHVAAGLIKDRDIRWLWHLPASWASILGMAWGWQTHFTRSKEKNLIAKLKPRQTLRR